jgi:hypothetical protein
VRAGKLIGIDIGRRIVERRGKCVVHRKDPKRK